jgi:hypothetical protein
MTGAARQTLGGDKERAVERGESELLVCCHHVPSAKDTRGSLNHSFSGCITGEISNE